MDVCLCCSAGEPLNPGAIAMFSVDHKSGRELRQYLSSVADQCEHGSAELPCVIILDSLHHVTSLSEVFNGFLSVHYQTRCRSKRVLVLTHLFCAI